MGTARRRPGRQDRRRVLTVSWQHWIILAWWAVGAVGAVLLIGEEREPLTPPMALFHLACSGVLVTLLVTGA